ncbi:MAG TPA: DUF2029 domain-containing protein [Roseiflexaceae bacterium]|nr:DUF2029 domain-containing protein [Roseiflexaceae bacterium]
MTETSAPAAARAGARAHPLRRALPWLPALLLAPVVAAQLAFFAVRAAHLLAYPYPLDYGEGPLLAQVQLLRAGTPLWALYADPGAPPYAVVNYPPAYHLASLLTSWPAGDPLLAGRLVSLLAALGSAAALWALSGTPANDELEASRTTPRSLVVGRWSLVARTLIVLAFLGLPIVREWAAVMRVDMLGVCLGLWGLALARRYAAGRAPVVWPAALLALSLFTKPSLVAAPAAALLWLLFRDWRRALRLGLALGCTGSAGVALLQFASGGWFLTHVVAANTNPIDRALGAAFWDDQLDILWPLFAAGALGAALVAHSTLHVVRSAPTTGEHTVHRSPFSIQRSSGLLPVYYTLFGALVALGVGKVGAYLNYFLELYAGLIWLAATLVARSTFHVARSAPTSGEHTVQRATFNVRGLTSRLPPFAAGIVGILVAGALLRYHPLWSETYLKPYGLIEGRNPPRQAFGSYGVWRDLAREAEVLGALARVNSALAAEVRAASAPMMPAPERSAIVTDLPGIAAQAGQLARHQAFEHRQLYDAGLWDQRPLLRDLASGRVPLVVLDYLGNWLTPEMIAIITHRYAQDGSRGPYDLYRPVAPGPLAPLDVALPGGLRATGVRLTPPGGAAYSAGELLAVTLELSVTDEGRTTNDQRASVATSAGTAPQQLLLRRGGTPPGARASRPHQSVSGAQAAQAPRQPPRSLVSRPRSAEAPAFEVVLQLHGANGAVLAESARPLLYGALPPGDWGRETVQHMQPLALPPALPPGMYALLATLRQGGAALTPPREVARITVGELSGRLLGEGGYFVPAPLLEAWAREGGYDGPGDPLTPAVPFAGYLGQCFQRACFRVAGGEVERVPLGALVSLAETGVPEGAVALDDRFRAFWEQSGGEATLGPPVTPPFARGDRLVQYTRYARLERPRDGGEIRLANLGEEFLRLPGGVAYRWP